MSIESAPCLSVLYPVTVFLGNTEPGSIISSVLAAQIFLARMSLYLPVSKWKDIVFKVEFLFSSHMDTHRLRPLI